MAAESGLRYIGMRLPAEMFSKVEDVLAGESLQITEYVRGLIREDLRSRGLLKNEDAPARDPQPAAAV